MLADNDATAVEKTLVSDVLVYIREAYNYSGFSSHNDAEEITRVTTLINYIIGEDYTSSTADTEGNTNPDASGAVTGVTFNLDAKPTIRFYVTDVNTEFYAGGKKLDTVKNETENYVEIDVYAYALCETIIFGNGGGSYHISSFLEGAGEAEKTLVAAFIKYTESAAAYRNSVVNK